MEGIFIKENLACLRREITNTALKAGRNPDDISILAVTKTVPVELMAVAVQEGITDLGENRVQELIAKYPVFGPPVHWHLIGHLQTNKVKAVVSRVHLIHSLDSWRLAEEIDRRSREAGVVTDVLIQVNVSGEKSKYGLKPAEVSDFIIDGHSLTGISVRGLMTVAPLVDDPEEVRPVFRGLSDLYKSIKKMDINGLCMNYLSMGMSNDYRVAVEEGANILRIGTGIFGLRTKN